MIAVTAPESIVALPLAWIVTVITALSASIATMAGIMWRFMQARLAAQDSIIGSQNATIGKLQDDIERLSKGCGHPDCSWRGRA